MRQNFLVVTLLCISCNKLFAQELARPVAAESGAASRSGTYVFFGAQSASFSGAGLGSGRAGILGLGLERPIGTRYSWHAEMIYGATLTRIPYPDDAFSVFTAHLKLDRLGIAVGGRRYFHARWYGGLGVSVAKGGECRLQVDVESLGESYYEDQLCTALVGRSLKSESPIFTGMLTAGRQLGRFSLELRLDQGLTPVVSDAGDPARTTAIGAALYYRFGRRSKR